MKKQKMTLGSVPPQKKNILNAKVDYCRHELVRFFPQYALIRDAIAGENAIKGITGSGNFGLNPALGNGGGLHDFTNVSVINTGAAKRYLPMPNSEDQSSENQARYASYVTRAVWYDATWRTLEGMAGQVFLRAPEVNIPKELEFLLADADGAGLGLDQLAYRAVQRTMAFGRAGILVDYPTMDRATTKADIADGFVRPTVSLYQPWDILNWRMERVGARWMLTMVVLRDWVDNEESDGFTYTQSDQYRVLRLDETGQSVDVFRKSKGGVFEQVGSSTYTLNANGDNMPEIPFHFIGSENNDAAPDRPPMYGLASLNIAHYRNSADYEESAFFSGQPTLVLNGLTQDWVDNVMKGNVALGSRAAIPLPIGADAKLLQVNANTLPFEAMHQKEQQMVALGAKLIQSGNTKQTATAKIIDTTTEGSTLGNVSKNVSLAFVWALQMSLAFIRKAKVNPTEIKYILNKDFDLSSMTADDQNAVIKQWQSGAISFPEMRTVLRRAGTASMKDDEARAAIQKDITDGLIPDPAAQGKAANVPDPNAPSNAGGPQPGTRQRQPPPGR